MRKVTCQFGMTTIFIEVSNEVIKCKHFLVHISKDKIWIRFYSTITTCIVFKMFNKMKLEINSKLVILLKYTVDEWL